MKKLKLIGLKKANNKKHKYIAEFSNGKKTKFGSYGYSDYTKHKDKDRKARYISRHSNEDWSDPTKAGTLSRYILWNKPTLKASISDYKSRFKV